MTGDGADLATTRRVLLSGAAALAAAVAGCSGDGGTDDGTTTADPTTARTTTAAPATTERTTTGTTPTTTAGPEAAVDEWLADTGNYDGSIRDATGESEVSVTVGAEGNGANFAFDPPAVRVATGTTVVWEWNGKGSQHNVAERDGAFESEQTGEAGHTYGRTFGDPGVVRYQCDPHAGAGMKGAVVVEDG